MEQSKPVDELRDAAREIFTRSLQSCSVAAMAAQKWRVSREAPDTLEIEGYGVLTLERVRRLIVIAVGKAAGPMLQALLERLSVPAGCRVEGVLIAPSPMASMPGSFAFFEGGHPLPTEASFRGAHAALRLLQDCAALPQAATECHCLFLLSGGASAMLELPLSEHISLEETQAFHHALVHSGASIAEINCVRKHFSVVKGGRMRVAAGAMPMLTLAVSDVPEQELDVLGSGPTLPDTSTVQDCRAVLARYQLMPHFPAAVRNFFESRACEETPKAQGMPSSIALLLSAGDLGRAAQQHAEALGFHVLCDHTPDNWDYRVAAEYLVSRLRTLRPRHTRLCLISAGEVTVTIPPQQEVGAGGRNQQFALYLATLLQPSDGRVAVLSGGSDGIDGNSSAAGAVLMNASLDGIETAAQHALQSFDAFPFLHAIGATVMTGPTGNNLRDLRILLSATA